MRNLRGIIVIWRTASARRQVAGERDGLVWESSDECAGGGRGVEHGALFFGRIKTLRRVGLPSWPARRPLRWNLAPRSGLRLIFGGLRQCMGQEYKNNCLRACNVDFYLLANAGGRLFGTLLPASSTCSPRLPATGRVPAICRQPPSGGGRCRVRAGPASVSRSSSRLYKGRENIKEVLGAGGCSKKIERRVKL